jgi:hypothetical protein
MATVTPNFNWPVPTSTDLVKDGATAIEALGDSIDASMVDLKGGTTGQVLSKASNTDMDFTWVTDAAGDITGVTAGTGISGGGTSGTVTVTNSMATAIDAKGDLVPGTGSDTFARLAVGANGTVLTADSAETTGLKWATPSGGGFPVSTVFTPTVTSQGGSITTYTATGSYQQSGKLVVANFKITLTNVGTASGTLYCTLPIQAVTLANGTWNGTCVENQTTGKTGIVSVTSGATIFTSRDYNFTTWFQNGYVIYGSVAYEVA